MSHALIDDDTDFGSVIVPDPGDARTAASVDTPFQAVANRTANVNARLLQFGNQPELDDGTDASVVNFKNVFDPSEDSNFGNIYRLIFEFAVENGVKFRGYAGNSGFAWTANAKWDPATALWTADFATNSSVQLAMFSSSVGLSGMAVHFKPAGASPWAEAAWDNDDTNEGAFGAAGLYNYFTAKAISLNQNVNNYSVDSPSNWTINAGFEPVATADGVFLALPLRLPKGAVLVQLQVVHKQNTVDPDTFSLVRRTTNYVTPSQTLTTLGTATGPASSGLKTTLVPSSPLSELIDNEANDYYLIFGAAKTNNELNAVRAAYFDPGPRNH